MPTNKKSIFAVIALLMAAVLLLSACAAAATPTESAAAEVPKPSNPGGPGDAVKLTGDATKGAAIYANTCVACHAAEGKGGVKNPGSDDGTVPPLNPIDAGLVNSDTKVMTQNLDLFVEHGSKPEGDSPALQMTAFGDTKVLTPQQIADVIAYVISLNKK